MSTGNFSSARSPPNSILPDFDEVGNRILSYDAYKPLIVGPRSTALAPLLDIEPAILRQVRDLQGRVLVWGWAEYDEVFSDAKRHRTEFCYQLVVSGSPAAWSASANTRLHNGVDEDCTKKPTVLVRALDRRQPRRAGVIILLILIASIHSARTAADIRSWTRNPNR